MQWCSPVFRGSLVALLRDAEQENLGVSHVTIMRKEECEAEDCLGLCRGDLGFGGLGCLDIVAAGECGGR